MQQTWNTERAQDIALGFKTMQGGLIPALHALQDEFGYVDDDVLPVLAKVFNLSNADIFGIITFYHDFKRNRTGSHSLKVCRGEACQSMGSEDLLDRIKDHLNVVVGGKTLDGAISLDHVFCLGNCALSPSIMINKTLYGRVTPQRLETLISRLEK